jgi:hypothetical protein
MAKNKKPLLIGSNFSTAASMLLPSSIRFID